jgi:hypothetical protein
MTAVPMELLVDEYQPARIATPIALAVVRALIDPTPSPVARSGGLIILQEEPQ